MILLEILGALLAGQEKNRMSLDFAAKLRQGADGARWRVAANVRNVVLLRVAALLFILPNALFAVHLGPLPGAILLIGCGLAALVIAQSDAAARQGVLAQNIDLAQLFSCALAAAALCLLGGQGHFFYANPDWLFRDAILSDLVKHGFPLLYTADGQDYLLRAPLGFYLTPALVGRVFGVAAARLAAGLEMGTILAIVLYFLAQLAERRKLLVLALFLAFSGMDILGELFSGVASALKGGEFGLHDHLEWWNGEIQYSSHVTQLFWVPNHALPGWWFALLTLFAARREIDADLLLVSFAALLMWSPLAMMGGLPFLCYFGLRAAPHLFERPMALAIGAALGFLPVAAYLATDAGMVKHMLLLGAEGFVALYLIFIVLELPHLALLAAARDKIAACDRAILRVAAGALLLIPIYVIGDGDDFAMRASIPALFILAFVFARVAVAIPRDGGRLATAVSVIVLLSAATPFFEAKRSFSGGFAYSGCNFLTTWPKAGFPGTPYSYLARVEKVPAWLIDAKGDRLAAEPRVCWPDHPVLPPEQR